MVCSISPDCDLLDQKPFDRGRIGPWGAPLTLLQFRVDARKLDLANRHPCGRRRAASRGSGSARRLEGDCFDAFGFRDLKRALTAAIWPEMRVGPARCSWLARRTSDSSGFCDDWRPGLRVGTDDGDHSTGIATAASCMYLRVAATSEASSNVKTPQDAGRCITEGIARRKP